MSTNYERIPEELKILKQWVCWRADKSPVNPNNPDKLGKSNDPETWSDFETAMRTAKVRNLGIGFMFANGYFGVDIDKCITDGVLSDVASDIIKTMDSYTEYSPSGTGIHIIAKGTIPPNDRRNGHIEMYNSGRYFTMTGNVIDDGHDEVCARSDEAEIVHTKYIKRPGKTKEEPTRNAVQVTLGEDEIIRKASASKQGYKFNNLLRGSWQGDYKSQSEAEQGFCNMLAFWTQKDFNLMDSIFRTSGLYRKKWDEKHGKDTYGNLTLQKAIRDCRDMYDPKKDRQTTAAKHDKTTAAVECMFDVKFCDFVPAKGKYKPRNVKENIEKLLSHLKIEAKYNELTKRLDIIIPNKTYSPDNMDELCLQHIYNECIKHDFSGISKELVDSILLEIGDKHRYNPVKEYLERVHSKYPESGLEEFEKLEASLVTFGFDAELKRTLLKRWLISCVRAMHTKKGIKAEGVLVLQGPQGIGKTTWFKKLVPDTEWFKDGVTLDPNNKDSVSMATKYWICELGEIGSTFKRDIDALKQFLTKQSDEIRLPYARKVSRFPRRTIFGGSVNNEEFLKDDTGSRRFWVIPVQDIDMDASINVDKLWSEVSHLEKQGEQHWLTTDELQVLNESNKAFEEKSVIDTILEAYFVWEKPERHWLKASNIFSELGQPNGVTLSSISRALKKLNCSNRMLDGYKYFSVPRPRHSSQIFKDTYKEAPCEIKNVFIQSEILTTNT